MSTTLRIDSFAERNIVERGVLQAEAEAGDTKLELVSTEGFEVSQSIYVGTLSSEGVEKAVVDAVSTPTELTIVSPLKMAHRRSEAVTAVLGDRIKIYRAANVDGTAPAPEEFTLLATRTIDADQPSTYYRDTDGSSAYWYAYSYFNPTTEEETDRSEPIRGDDFEHYAALSPIRKKAGFQGAVNLADSYVEEARRKAESRINSALAKRYKTPFAPVPEIIRTLTIEIAAALLKMEYGYSGNDRELKALDAQLEALASGEASVPGEDGNDLSADDGVTGYFGTEPRMFHVGQKF